MSATPKPTVPELIDLLERAVFQRRTDDGVKAMLELVTELNSWSAATGLLEAGHKPEDRRALYTRMAAMVTALVCSPDFRLDLNQITQLAGRKSVLEAIFELSGYEGPFHLLHYNGGRNPDGSVTLNSGQIFVLSLFYSLDALPDTLLGGVLRLPPDQLMPLMLGWLSVPFVHSDVGEANRRRLIDESGLIANATPTPSVVQAICSAWMHCSYADHANKHFFKTSLNSVWHTITKMAGVKARSAPRRVVDKPVLVVPAERMNSGHAMHRCYGPGLEQLRQRFEVVCVVAKPFYDPKLDGLFDRVEVVEPTSHLKEYAARIVKAEPDVIFYPSLGMSEWTQALANLRMAPVQIMTVGHPAPAMCDTIDYSLVHAGVGEFAQEFGRKVIERKIWGRFEPHMDVENHVVSGEKFDDGRIHLAVNSSLMKLSPRFLKLCERIETNATRPVHFHFFASASGVAYDRIKQVFERRFRYFTLEPSRRYGAFLQVLERCHLALAAFPFGNTNSTVDTCLVHVPTVAFKGQEVLSIFDRDVLRMAGMPDWLACETDDAYYETTMRLIHEDDLRAELVERLRQGDLRRKLFEWHDPSEATEFVEAIDWIYRNHEALQASPAHLIKVGEPIPT